MKKLDEIELNNFVKKYMSEWADDIVEVNYMDLEGLKIYLVNRHYLLIDNGFKVIEKGFTSLIISDNINIENIKETYEF